MFFEIYVSGKYQVILALMKMISPVLYAFLWMPFSCKVTGQDQSIYTIRFQSGSLVPEANVSNVARNASGLQQGKWNSRYFLVIQFARVPDSAMKSTLTKWDIKLHDYLPQLAYTVSIPANFKFKQLQSLPVRSIFPLQASYKMSAEINERKIPEWAAVKKGWADVQLITFEPIHPADFTREIAALQGELLHTDALYNMYTVRISADKLSALASLPFVLWIEPIAPPVKAEKEASATEQMP